MSIENPPAFPLSPGDVPYYQEGMTLRDWFAGQAISGIIMTCGADTDARKMGHAAYFAFKAYEVADAMLAERAKVNP